MDGCAGGGEVALQITRVCACVQASGSRGSGVITQYQSLPLAPRKVLPICVTQSYYPSGLPGELSF